ncbi:hypothetical protein X975_17270, partial [Stegodyphus mimosarum]
MVQIFSHAITEKEVQRRKGVQINELKKEKKKYFLIFESYFNKSIFMYFK